MDMMCLVGLFPDEYKETVEKDSVGGMQNAANKLQWGIVRGLDRVEGVKVTLANSMYIGAYPRRYRKAKIPTFRFSHTEGAEDVNVGFLNLPGIKMFSRYSSVKKVLKEWASAPSEPQAEEKVLLVYALTVPFTQLAGYVTRKFPHVKVCIVVPDLPEYMAPLKMQKDVVFRTLKKAEIRLIRHSIRRVEDFVFLTDTMKEWFDRPIRYTVMEGVAQDVIENEETAERKHTILYAGGVKAEYGVVALAEAFAKTAAGDWELEIYGAGPASDRIDEIAAECPAVKRMGRVPNEVVLEAQRRASVLVNPRENQPFTRYSFPSKILEYMSSGTPVLAYKLDGMPEEYAPYYYRIPDEKGGMEEALGKVMNLTDEERAEMGRRAKEFVRDEKNPKTQCEKIVRFLAKDKEV